LANINIVPEACRRILQDVLWAVVSSLFVFSRISDSFDAAVLAMQVLRRVRSESEANSRCASIFGDRLADNTRVRVEPVVDQSDRWAVGRRSKPSNSDSAGRSVLTSAVLAVLIGPGLTIQAVTVLSD